MGELLLMNPLEEALVKVMIILYAMSAFFVLFLSAVGVAVGVFGLRRPSRRSAALALGTSALLGGLGLLPARMLIVLLGEGEAPWSIAFWGVLALVMLCTSAFDALVGLRGLRAG